MCQLCPISTLATARWPKPLESSITDLTFLISCIHTQHVAWKKAEAEASVNIENERTALLSLLRTLSGTLTSLSHERRAWWQSKTPLIKELKEDVSGQGKLTQLHKINNAAAERIEGMEAKLGGFVRWSLGMEGGVEGLLNGEAAGGEGAV